MIHNDVRTMLHKKWLTVGTAWAAIKAKEGDGPGKPMEPLGLDDRVRLADGQMGHVRDINAIDDMFLLELAGKRQVKKMPLSAGVGSTSSMANIWQYKTPADDEWVEFELEQQQKLSEAMESFETNRGADEEVEISTGTGGETEHNFIVCLRTMATIETAWMPRDQLQKEGDIERMQRVFQSAREFQERAPMKRWEVFFPGWEE